MPKDPITNSMLGNSADPGTPKSGPHILDDLRADPSTDPVTNAMLDMPTLDTPFIDVFDLDLYTESALKQVVVDLRIKRARINAEIVELNKIINKFHFERANLLSRQGFYQDVIVAIQHYFEEKAPCQTNSPDIPPSQN